MTEAAIFLLGLVIGSFLNVCILRIPREESVVLPSSHCTACNALIKPYDNIPVVSWLILGGHCRKCKMRISAQYPVVELLTGLLFLVCYVRFGLSTELLKWLLFASLLVVLIITNIRDGILPDKVNVFGLGAGLLLSLVTAPIDGMARWISGRFLDFLPPNPILSVTDAVLGASVASGFLWLVAEGYFRLRQQEGIGLGNIKMMAMAGVFLGVQRGLLTIVLGFLVSCVTGTALIARGQRDFELPFGSFLGIVALLVIFLDSSALAWLLSSADLLTRILGQVQRHLT